MAPEQASGEALDRGSAYDNTSVDTVNPTTHGAWKYFLLTG
ncbi:hypothetical protein [Streptomyces sp. NBC_01455]|nr:hypothetical protein [Streptomyces sp. NBC_01455]